MPTQVSLEQQQDPSKSDTSHTTQPFEFNAIDFKELCINRYNRFLPNSKTVGHAVIQKSLVKQYALPSGIPSWTPLTHIRPIQRYGKTAYLAQTLEGAPMYSTRGYQATDGNANGFEVRVFSPLPPDGKEPFWESTNLDHIFAEPIEIDDAYMKGGRELEVEKSSIEEREGQKRSPSQNEVMGMSAKEAYELFLEKWGKTLTPDMHAIFKRAIDAPLRHVFYSNFRPEWLHAEGYTLTPSDINPQRSDNLGSAAKWANTAMMIYESMAKWFALHCPGALVTIKPSFEMLLDSELIKTIDFDLRLEFKDKHLVFKQHLEPIRQKSPVFKKASDIAQLTGIAHALFTDKKPVAKEILAHADTQALDEKTEKMPVPIDKEDASYSPSLRFFSSLFQTTKDAQMAEEAPSYLKSA